MEVGLEQVELTHGAQLLLFLFLSERYVFGEDFFMFRLSRFKNNFESSSSQKENTTLVHSATYLGNRRNDLSRKSVALIQKYGPFNQFRSP